MSWFLNHIKKTHIKRSKNWPKNRQKKNGQKKCKKTKTTAAEGCKSRTEYTLFSIEGFRPTKGLNMGREYVSPVIIPIRNRLRVFAKVHFLGRAVFVFILLLARLITRLVDRFLLGFFYVFLYSFTCFLFSLFSVCYLSVFFCSNIFFPFFSFL